MRKLFDLIIDILLFLGYFICNIPSWIARNYKNIQELYYKKIKEEFGMLPYKISLIYRFRKMWYPTASDFNPDALTIDMEEWLDTNVGKYRWKTISRLKICKNENNYYNNNYFVRRENYLCFRYKNDVVAFKLRWIE